MKINQNIDYKIRLMKKPQMAIVPLKVANGDSALPVVKMNEIVKCGQVIAKSSGFNSVDVFSPVYGKIIGFDSYPLSDHSKAYCVYIENLEKEENKDTNSETGAQSTDCESAPQVPKTEKNKIFTFKILDSNSKALILKRLADCGVIDHNGDSISDKLSNKYKILCIPCFDALPYACENTAVLASEYFDKAYNISKKLANVFDLPVVFVCQKGDEMTGVEQKYDTKTELKNGKFYKLFVRNIDANKIFSKFFAQYFSSTGIQTDAKNNKLTCDSGDENSTNKSIENFENEQNNVESKSDLLNDMLNNSGTKINIRKEDIEILNADKNENAINTGKEDIGKFAKMRSRALQVSPYKNLENMLVLTPIDLLHIYRAIECGIPQTTAIATFGGSAITTNGVYEICSGCTLEHIQNSLGGTHSEQDIEDDKADAYDAIEEFYDARAKFKEEKDESKKVELKKVMQQKKRTAKTLALNFVKTSKRKLKTCLGQIAFDDPEKGETFGDFRAVFELRNHGIYYLACKEC